MGNKSYPLSVKTADGDVELIVCHSVENQDEENMLVTISTTIQGKSVVFQSDTTEYALLQLASNLPAEWSVKCCLSCRYGHFCPTGDYDNELFCVTEFEPKESRDLWQFTEDVKERAQRSHMLFDVCEKFAPQSKDYFTYSDYYRYLNSKE